MGKTSKQETAQQIDPQLREEADITMDGGRMLAALGYNPYMGNTISDFTEAQRGGFQGMDMASTAFGMPAEAERGMPTGGQAGANGIVGFSPQRTMEKESPISPEVQSALDAIYAQLGTQSTDQAQPSVSGGKK